MAVAMNIRPTYAELQAMSATEIKTWLVETKTIKDYGDFRAKPVFVET